MSGQPNDGGPAYPSSPAVGISGELYRPVDIGCEGMSLRDYFAGQALIALLNDHSLHDATNATMAKYSYQLSDAMLAEREKGGDK